MKKVVASMAIVAILFTVVAAFFSAFASAVTSFSDVKEYDLYSTSVNYLRENEVVVGYSDGTYGLNNDINRAEFLKIVMEVSEYEPAGGDCFPDVSDQWFAPYICKADELGFVDGYPDGSFKPNEKINFAEASKVITNILDIELDPDDENWFTPYVRALETTESIPAEISQFDENISRGDMAEMIWRIDTERTYKISNTYENIARGKEAKEAGAQLQTFDSCTELEHYFEDNTSTNYYYDLGGFVVEDSMESDAAAPMATSGASFKSESSSTNVQVVGVDEADIVKNDGEYIYMIKGDDVRVIDGTPVGVMEELSAVEFADDSFYPSEMYVDEDRLTVIGSDYTNDFGNATSIFIFDISDKRNIKQLREITYEGSYNTSRKIGDIVYVVMNRYTYYWNDYAEILPMKEDTATSDTTVSRCGDVKYMPGNVGSSDYTIVSAIDVREDDSPVEEELIVGSRGTVYSSSENLYIAEARYNNWWWYEESGNSEETYIHKFALDGVDLDYRGVGTVPGTTLNQFSMDEDGDYFRIATTTGWWEQSGNNVYVLDNQLQIVGSVEGLAPGEDIHSTRFMGDRLYMVTFEQIDPLFVIDLGTPTNPKVLGELHIPGVSDYLHPLDSNHIIGFGLDTASADVIARQGWSWFQGIKMSLFDVTDVENPVELHKVVIGDRGSTSELLYNHKALLYDNGMMAFPVTVAEIPESVKENLDIDSWIYGDKTFQGAYIYDVSVKDGFELRGRISQYEEDELGADFDYYYYYGDDKNIDRILFMGDNFYTVSENIVQANDMDSLDEVNEVILN